MWAGIAKKIMGADRERRRKVNAKRWRGRMPESKLKITRHEMLVDVVGKVPEQTRRGL